MKKGIVAHVQFKKSGTGQYGEYHIFEITFQNNDKGDYMAKTNPQKAFVIGQEAEYTIESKQHGEFTNYQVKPVNNNKQFGNSKPFNPIHANRQCALNNAVAMFNAGKIEERQLYQAADKLFKWLQNETPTT